jgi:hypothetical protein
MPTVMDLLFAYGLCFGLQNKVEALRSPKWRLGAFFERMLSCSYCTGFHAGWLAWAISRLYYGVELSPASLAPAVAWAFASAAFCFVIDVASQAAESMVAKASTSE